MEAVVEKKKWGRKYDVYVYKVIDENNIKVCDGQEENAARCRPMRPLWRLG